MKTIFFIITLGFFFLFKNEITNLKTNRVPTSQEASNFKFNSKTEYEVYKENDIGYYRSYDYNRIKGPGIALKIDWNKNNNRDFGGKQQNVKLSNGYLIGFDKGEFGGSLYWFDNNGIENYKICSGNIKDILILKDKILVTEGLAHLGSDSGQILELIQENGKWVSKKYIDLNNVPYATNLNTKNELIILTSKQLLKVTENKQVSELISQGFWSGLYPNSSIIQNDVIYFGMRNGILKMNLNTEKIEWLTE